MKDLLELVQIVTKPKLRSVELIGDVDTDSRIAEFYDGLTEGRYESDEEAAEDLYGVADKNHPAYQKLRKTVKDRLINSLFIIDIKQASYTDRQKAFYECYKDWAAAKILFGKNARTAGLGMCLKIQKVAKKLEFTELLLDIYRTLRLYYGTIEGDVKKYEQYNKAFKNYEAIWQAENLAEELYVDLSVRFVNSKATKTEVQAQAQSNYDQLQPLLDKYDSYQIQLCGRLIEMIIPTSVNDYSAALEVCDRTIEFFAKKPYLANVPLQISYYQKMICYVQLRQFDLAREAGAKCIALLEAGSFNWFKYRELYFILLMHSEEYDKAYELHKETVEHAGFDDLPRNQVETWLIFDAMLKYLMLAGRLKLPGKVDAEDVNFRLARFLNEMAVLSKDKRGMNIPILVIEMIYHILTDAHDYAVDRVEAVDKYRSRHLKEEDTHRSNLFIRMLLQIPKNGFNRKEVEEKARKDFEALKEIPIELANQTYEIEIIPYEKLWEIVLDNL